VTTAPTSALREAFAAALEQLDPARLVRDALPAAPPRRARVVVIAAGKAAARMTDGAFAAWGERIEHALVVTADAGTETGTDTDAGTGTGTGDGSGAGAGLPDARVTRLVAGHPLPDARSIRAAELALGLARSLGPADVLVALVSGGASALLCAPPPGMDLTSKRGVVDALLRAGAPIAEVNLVRRHLSAIKGGRLAATAGGARVLTLLVGDVIGGTPGDIGSGPTLCAPLEPDAARAVLERWAPALVPSIVPHLAREPFPEPRTRTRLLAGPDDLARAVARELEPRGFTTQVHPADQGELSTLVERRAAIAKSLAPGDAAVIATEPTLRLPAHPGRGGRAGRCALMLLPHLPPDVALLCGASDGRDGTGDGGAVVSGALQVAPDRLRDALDRYDDAPLHAALGSALPGGATGNNLADVHILARARTPANRS
jgi:glycerate 2-kinase